MEELNGRILCGTPIRLTVAKAIFRLGKYKCGAFGDDSWIAQHHEDSVIHCTFCNKAVSNRRSLGNHWTTTHHHSGNILTARNQRQCPIPQCEFKQTKRRGALLKHLRTQHTVTQLLVSGFDSFKIRRDTMSYGLFRINLRVFINN